MNLNVTGHHLDITPAMREHLTSKLERLTRHFDHVIDINVILAVERTQHKAEANVHVRGKDLFAESHGEDMYAAIDALVAKLDRQIVKHKEKLTHGRSGSSAKPDTP